MSLIHILVTLLTIVKVKKQKDIILHNTGIKFFKKNLKI